MCKMRYQLLSLTGISLIRSAIGAEKGASSIRRGASYSGHQRRRLPPKTGCALIGNSCGGSTSCCEGGVCIKVGNDRTCTAVLTTTTSTTTSAATSTTITGATTTGTTASTTTTTASTTTTSTAPPPTPCPDPCIIVDTSTKYQTFYGVGASMTGSSALNLFDVDVSESLRDSMLEALFDPVAGIGLNLVRQPMGSSDFSTAAYTYEDVRGFFDISKDYEQQIIPALQSALAVNQDIKIIGTPLSYPAWMKENGSLNGGTIKSNLDYAFVGDYFKNYVAQYALLGLPVWAVSVQNEPLHSSDQYSTMTMTPVEHAAAAIAIRSALDLNQQADVKVIGYDHNWDRPDYPLSVLSDAYNAIDATAFHCYAGNVENQLQVEQQYRDKDIFFTECTEYGDHFYEGDFRWAMNNLVFGSIQNYASTLFEWNLILDANYGPKLPGGCTNCRGLLNLDTSKTTFTKSPAYFAFGHVSKFVKYGAKRVDSIDVPNLSSLAFENDDRSGLLIVQNDRRKSERTNVKLFGKVCLDVELPGMTTLSLYFDNSGSGVVLQSGSPTFATGIQRHCCRIEERLLVMDSLVN